jgi:ABC-type Na+ efflux pump permease subunit
MNKVWIIARKELISSFRQRNMILLMFLSPIVLVTIMGLAFGGLVSGSESPIADIPVAVVNLDQGAALAESLPTTLGAAAATTQTLSTLVGALAAEDVIFHFGDQLAAILLSQPVSGTVPLTSTPLGVALNQWTCPLSTTLGVAPTTAEANGLDAFLNAVPVADPIVAWSGVASGDYVAAVIIPADFSRGLLPTVNRAGVSSVASGAPVEVVANEGNAIAATIVRAIVGGIVGQFERTSVNLTALIATSFDLPVAPGSNNPPASDSVLGALAAADITVLEPLACLFQPGLSNLQLVQQPIDEVQGRTPLGMLMVVLGGSQAVFFALFTGIFGINSIYEDRIQGTLQRVLVSPTPSSAVLAGRLLGNLALVMAQLSTLLLAFTAIVSLLERQPTFIWGDHPLLLLLLLLGLSLFTTSLGVLIVGLARTSEQVQLIGPLITLVLGVLGGTFGAWLPSAMIQLSPIWWGTDAMRKLAANDIAIWPHLTVLFGVGMVFAAVGTVLFRRRMGL